MNDEFQNDDKGKQPSEDESTYVNAGTAQVMSLLLLKSELSSYWKFLLQSDDEDKQPLEDEPAYMNVGAAQVMTSLLCESEQIPY